MLVVPIVSITIPPSRHRREFRPQPLADLAASIKSRGLLQPIVVRSGENETYTLVAGERRMRAIETLDEPYLHNDELVPAKSIPAVLFEDLDPLAQREAELFENLLREALTWQEHATALNDLHNLRLATNPKQTVIATAKEVSQSTGDPVAQSRVQIARARLVSQHIADPKVVGSRNLKEAYNIVSRAIEADFKLDLIAAQQTATPHRFILGDCLEIMRTMEGNQFDCILTDPPYGIGADSFGKAGAPHTYTDSRLAAINLSELIIQMGFQLAKPQAHLYLFCDIDHFHTLRDFATAYGWHAWRTPLIWDKGGAIGHDPIPGQGFRRSYELILYAIKGNKPHHAFLSDVIDVPTSAASHHPAAKPVELFHRFLSRSCTPGDKVLDPCCGTGTIFPAATKSWLSATGIEIDPDFAKLAEARMYEKE